MNTERSWEEYISGEIYRIKMVGKSLIYPQRQQAWDELVMKQVNSLIILNIALQKMQALEAGKSFEEVDGMHNIPGSVDSYVRQVIAFFSKQGPDYYEATAFQEISDEMKEYLMQKRKENAQFQSELETQRSAVR